MPEQKDTLTVVISHLANVYYYYCDGVCDHDDCCCCCWFVIISLLFCCFLLLLLSLYFLHIQEEDRRRKPKELEILRGTKLSANITLDSRTASTVPISLTQASHSVITTTKSATAGIVTHASTFPRSLLPPISHKRDISSASINRPLPVSFVCVYLLHTYVSTYIH